MGTSATQNRPSPASFLMYEDGRRRFTNIKKYPEISPARPPKVPIKCGNLFYGDLRRREKWSSKIYKTRKISKKYFPRDLQSPHKMWKPVLWGPPAHFRDSSWRHSVAGPSAQGPTTGKGSGPRTWPLYISFHLLGKALRPVNRVREDTCIFLSTY